MKRVYLLAALIILGLIASACSYSEYPLEEREKLAKCLTAKGVVEYGAFWCPTCAKQKKLFGEAYQYINYIECDPRDDAGQPDLCLEKEVEKYPDWEFPDGTRLVGLVELETLATTAGCEVPKLG